MSRDFEELKKLAVEIEREDLEQVGAGWWDEFGRFWTTVGRGLCAFPLWRSGGGDGGSRPRCW